MILVVGATGLVGSEICGQLAARGKQVRALVRATADPAKVDRLRALGAEITVGDLRDANSLQAACRGANAVITTTTGIFDATPQLFNGPDGPYVSTVGVRLYVTAGAASNVAREDTVRVNATTYTVIDIVDDATRIVELTLQRSA